MQPRTIERRRRAGERDTGVSTKCRVVGYNLSGQGDATVDIIPLEKTRIYSLDGEISYQEPLEIFEVPYEGLLSGPSFALWIPPEVGMEGWFVQTDYEVGEIASGEVKIERVKDKSSGWFSPGSSMAGPAFKGSADWLEFRGKNDTRVALSKDEVHLQAGDANICIKDGEWDIFVGGISLLEALQEMSKHIKELEDLVHPDPDGPHTHGGGRARKIDEMIKAVCPNRNESGVR